MFEYRNDEQHTHYIYLRNPSSLQSISDCEYQDSQLSRYITELQSEISTLQNLRQETFQRIRYLYSVPFFPKVTLTRERRFRDGKVYYYLCTWKIYDAPDIEPERISCETYPGTARHQAIKDFRAYVKAHPGIQSEMNIEKSRWER